MTNTIIDIVRINLGYELNKEIQVLDTLSDLEINSIVFIKIIVALEAEFDCIIDDDDLIASKYTTINDFISVIEKTLRLNKKEQMKV